MFLPKTLKEANLQKKDENTPEDLEFKISKRIHFVQEFKYLGSITTSLLNKDAEIESRIKKAWSLIGITKHVFDCKDINIHVKHQVYIGPLNTLLWGCECWNPMKRNLNKLRSFHHSAIRKILSWNQYAVTKSLTKTFACSSAITQM